MDEKLMDITTEENFEIEDAEIMETEVAIQDEEYDISTKEVEEIIEAEDVENIEIEVEEGGGWAGGDITRHYSLYGREDPNQHPIKAIEGLRQELDQIEALQTVYSDKKQQADYYLWYQDEEYTIPDNPHGLFVSICPNTDNIIMCDGTNDVFGVTVSEAAFVGNQEYAQAVGGVRTGRDGNYTLVSHSGIVGVRCETTVTVGDYVVPNIRGEAKKSDGGYGYLVTAMSDIDGVQHAIISLSTSLSLTKNIADGVKDLSGRMSTVEYNVASVTNVANSAYAIAQGAKDATGAIGEQVNNAISRVDAVEGTVGNLSESISDACASAALAKVVAEGAVSSAEAIRTEVVTKANEANANVNNLIKELEPITTWVDPATGNSGAEYLTTYITDGLATKIELQTVDTKTDEAFSAIEKNAKSLQSFVSTIDKYAVGEYSPAYGLTKEQAKSILKPGYIYIPTVKHDGEYIYNDHEFQLGYYYTWDGEQWKPSMSTAVSFSSVFILGSEATPYWVVTESDVIEDGITYDLGGLYKWENGAWFRVAAVADNTISRSISSIVQTANSIDASVQDIKGGVSALELRIDGAESSVTTLASHIIGDYVSVESWNEDGKDTSKVYLSNDTGLYWYYSDGVWKSTETSSEAGLTGTLATIEQKANENGASISQIVSAVGKDGEITATSIVQAINDGKSSVSISGDCINLTGKVTFSSFDKETQKKIEADSIDVQIWSSRGNIFKGRDVSTILTCHVFSAGVDITGTLPNSAFMWEKINNDGTKDETWSATPYGNNANSIQVTSADVWSRAVFNCAVEI